MAINDIIKLTLEGTGPQNQQLINTLHYKHTDGTSSADGFDLINGWVATAGEEFTALLADVVTWTEMHTRNLTQPLFGLDYTLEPPRAGDIVEECLPPQCAAVLQIGTGLIGPRSRGRNYIWPTGVGQQTSGIWDTAYLSALSAYGTAIREVISAGATFELVVLAGIDPGDPPVGLLVTTVSGDPVVRTQRRRVVGEGA